MNCSLCRNTYYFIAMITVTYNSTFCLSFSDFSQTYYLLPHAPIKQRNSFSVMITDIHVSPCFVVCTNVGSPVSRRKASDVKWRSPRDNAYGKSLIFSCNPPFSLSIHLLRIPSSCDAAHAGRYFASSYICAQCCKCTQ